MRFKGTLILLGISLIVGAVYLFYLLPAEKEKRLREELSNRFFRIDTSQVEFMRIQNPGGAFNMAKENDQWKLTSPLMLPTDSRTIEEILKLINEGRIIKVITYDINRASEFELDYPRAVLFIGYEGKIDELALGGVNPSNTGIYAFARGINAIFVVDKEIAKISSVGLYELRAKALFSFDPGTVTKINIIKGEKEIELRRHDKTWQMIIPVSGRADQDEVNDFLLGVLNQRADEFYDNRIPDAGDYSDTIILLLSNPPSPPFTKGGDKLSPPLKKGDIGGFKVNDSSIKIDVHYWGTAADQGVVAYQQGMKYSGRLPRDFWNFINREASDFRYRELFDFDKEEFVK